MTEEREEFAVGDRVWNTQTGQTGKVIALSPTGSIATSMQTQRMRDRRDREVPYYRARWQFTKNPATARRHFRTRMESALAEAQRWETILGTVVA